MNKTIGAATYLTKGNEDYIPFRLKILGTYCAYINEMLE